MKKLTFLAILLWIQIAVPVFATEFVIGTRYNLPISEVSAKVLKKAYQNLEINIMIKKSPAARSLRNANQGKIDGELQRIGGLTKTYPNLIQLPISHITGEGWFFTKKEVNVVIRSWQDLKSYRIGIINGVKYAEKNSTGLQVRKTTTSEQLMKMLDRGRVDFVFDDKYNGLLAIRNAKLQTIHHLTPPIVLVPLYHYLHKKHQNLIPQLAKIIQEMENSGEIQKLIREFEKNFLLDVERQQ